MKIDIQDKGDVKIFNISGVLTVSNATQLKTLYLEPENKSKYYIFDLANLELLDSTGLGAIVFCLRDVKENGAKLAICHVVGKPKMVFEITRAHRIFDIFDSEEKAIEFLHKSE